MSQKPYTQKYENHWIDATVTFDCEPRISPMGELSFEIKLHNKLENLYQLQINVMTPDTWSANYPKHQALLHYTGAHDYKYRWRDMTDNTCTFKVTLNAGEVTSGINKVYVAIEPVGYPVPLIIPVTILG